MSLRINWSVLIHVVVFVLGLFLEGIAYLMTERQMIYLALQISVGLIGLLLLGLSILFCFHPFRQHLYSNTGVSISRYICQSGLWLVVGLLLLEPTVGQMVGIHYFKPLTTLGSDFYGYMGKGTFIHLATEGFGDTTYSNSNDGEIKTPFDDGESVIVIGDSYTEALQVSNDQKYASVAEVVLHQAGYTYNLRNFGMSGNCPADYVVLIPQLVKKYNAVALVLQVSATDFNGVDCFSAGNKHYFIRGDMDLKIMTSPLVRSRPAIYYYFMRSSLIAAIWHRSKEIDLFAPPIGQVDDNASQIVPASEDDNDLMRKQLQLLNGIVVDLKIPIFVIVLPSVPRIVDNNILVQDQEFDTFIQEIEAQTNWIVVNPTPEFLKLPSQGMMPYGFFNSSPDSGHLNLRGHEIIGNLLAKQMEDILK